jgi:hypothetical protein
MAVAMSYDSYVVNYAQTRALNVPGRHPSTARPSAGLGDVRLTPTTTSLTNAADRPKRYVDAPDHAHQLIESC